MAQNNINGGSNIDELIYLLILILLYFISIVFYIFIVSPHDAEHCIIEWKEYRECLKQTSQSCYHTCESPTMCNEKGQTLLPALIFKCFFAPIIDFIYVLHIAFETYV